MASTKIGIINAALTRVGERPLDTLTEASATAKVVEKNYEGLMAGLLAGHRFRWTFQTKLFTGPIAIPSDLLAGWSFAYEIPPDCLRVLGVHTRGKPVDYSIKSDNVLTNASVDAEPVAVDYVWRVPEEYWPADFVEAAVQKLCAVFLRSKERWEEAAATDQAANATMLLASSLDAQTQTPRKPRSRRGLADVRRGR